MEVPDTALVLACGRGDEYAWESLVRRYQRLVYTVPRQAGLGEDDAAEVFQRVFASLLESLDTLEQPCRLERWLRIRALRETLGCVANRRQGRADPAEVAQGGQRLGRERGDGGARVAGLLQAPADAVT
jgi:DNA-directed RNA polymerase specialized sigma24 family protein